MIVVVCGSRGWTDVDTIEQRIARLPDDAIVVHGNARGADTIAGSVAWRRGLHVATFPALWNVHGKAAGPLRNQAMLNLHPQLVIAFSMNTPGTQDMIRRALATPRTSVEVIGPANERELLPGDSLEADLHRLGDL